MTYKFNDFQLRWLKALESGEYDQGQKYLCQERIVGNNETDGYKYCVLGVAVDLYDSDNWKPYNGVDAHIGVFAYKGNEVASLPHVVEKLLRLNTDDGEVATWGFADKVGFTVLTDANDDLQLSFKKIAKIIRENPEEFFDDAGVERQGNDV